MLVLNVLVFFAFWFFLSGKADAFHLALGFFTALSIALIHRKALAGLSLARTLELIARFFRYLTWLMWQIVLAAWHVSCVVLRRDMKLNPKFITHKTILRPDEARVIFANSITLTPGTITADLAGDTLVIHQLDDNSAGGIISHDMEKEIEKIYGAGS